MSLARLYTTKKSRKAWTCGNCHEEIPVGSKVIHFTVGYRGVERHRCGKTTCFPQPSERESSLLAGIYAAQESVDVSSAGSAQDIQDALQEVADAANEVADEYEGNEMFDVNEELQERADMVRSAADELESWEPSEEEPDEENYEDAEVDFSEAHEAWLQDAREEAQGLIDEMELP